MASIPPDVKHRIDRLVEFVARNGEAFEATACQRERGNPDFAFLTPGAPYADYYQWKKQQMCGPKPPILPTPSLPGPAGPSDLLSAMSVGALANVCRLARASGVPAYAPIPREIVLNVGTLPPVEPARLEIRLAEFYRDDHDANKSKRSVY
ncbi:hypothetical protein BBJ28_00017571 [Nothophytophthora sp. Chile5]|nr:hypothetical protein BBJ28_00017571 [Nothophytophthora sp. Chile5]